MGTVVNTLKDTIRILLVEDSPTDAELIQLTLLGEMDNLEFHRVFNDPDLRRELVEFNPELIISDYSMPGFSGLEALSICRTEKPDVPFIFVSGTIGEERAVEALKNGAHDYVLKDSLTRLPHAIKQSITLQQNQRQKKRQQDELARTHDLLNSIFDTTHMMVAYMDADFNFIQVNRSFGEMSGLPTNFLPGKNFFGLFPNTQKQKVFQGVIDSGRSHFEYMDPSFSRDAHNGKARYYDWSVAPTKNHHSIEGVVFTCVDTTVQVKLRSERDELLRTLEERVEQRTAELREANHQLAAFKKDITDSITYAKRIQDAFIPARTAKDFHVRNAFIVDIPRDILSGDFHWSHHSPASNCTYIVIADCTGHGVPASLMTLLGVQLLEQSLVGYSAKRSPAQVLQEMDEAIIRFLGQKDISKMINDGMEVVLLRVDHDDRKLMYASAGRPIYMNRADGLKRLGSTRAAVGGITRGREKFFDEFEVHFEEGDRFYAFSDGFVDQFGGDAGGKFMRKRLEALLTDVQKHPFDRHGKLLSEAFHRWKGKLPQIDDVIMLGLEL